jgi:hypothetical protein
MWVGDLFGISHESHEQWRARMRAEINAALARCRPHLNEAAFDEAVRTALRTFPWLGNKPERRKPSKIVDPQVSALQAEFNALLDKADALFPTNAVTVGLDHLNNKFFFQKVKNGELDPLRRAIKEYLKALKKLRAGPRALSLEYREGSFRIPREDQAPTTSVVSLAARRPVF